MIVSVEKTFFRVLFGLFGVNLVVLISADFLYKDDHIPDLPLDHYPCYFKSHRWLYNQICNASTVNSKIGKICKHTKDVGFKCWGYEIDDDCKKNKIYQKFTVCDGKPNGWAQSKAEQEAIFYEQGDFGYIRNRLKELKLFCIPKNSSGDNEYLQNTSQLECTRYLRFCRGRNIVIDLSKLLQLPEPIKYRSDVLDYGMIGGFNCSLNKAALLQEHQHKSPLQSWYDELQHYTVYKNNSDCDIVLKKPTFIMKLDATVNMYHHFCDFVNLYASLHLNNSFSTDNHILIWDTMPYRGNFAVVAKAFTKNPVLSLGPLKGKKICLVDAVFPLLPRMVFGLYYNMPLVPGCRGSGLFKAFNEFLMHRLDIKQNFSHNQKTVRVTLISRLTNYRRIINEDELIRRLKSIKNLSIKRAEFSHKMPFIEQIQISHNSDILIGMHGAGLTHCLFQPDWGVLFELYNCDDPNCYKDLAHLRGLKYLTWSKEDKVIAEEVDQGRQSGAHKKFTNYKFDADEFIKIVEKAIRYVKKTRKKYSTHNNNNSPSSTTVQHSEL